MLRDATEPESQGGRIWHGRELLCSKCRTVVVGGGGGGGAAKDNDATSKVTETSVLPFSSGGKIAVLEKCEKHGAG